MSLERKDIISAKQFSREELEYILNWAIKIENDKGNYAKSMQGTIMATLFYEPSTRTRLSFESAMHRLGGTVIGFSSSSVSSVKKGETLADTIRTVAHYSDLIVLRHNNDGAATFAARCTEIPVINAGSGSGEHPTQSLLDLLTIQQECGKIDGLNIGLIGDLKFGRTVHSLTYLLANYDINLFLISPHSLKMQNRVMDYIQGKGNVKIKETTNFIEALPKLDVIYMTRIQKERFPDPEEYESVKDTFKFEKEYLDLLKPNAKIMHPLPRVNEISSQVDDSPHAIYFKQTYYGLMMRKAIIGLVMGVFK
ncbi:MAG: aspartate carbamoyltransferase [Candidatus Lokiarchaeota archaeon]|nr:aspartate carbamoyltransferase [Candidatus Lokiarchaeota archaeon]